MNTLVIGDSYLVRRVWGIDGEREEETVVTCEDWSYFNHLKYGIVFHDKHRGLEFYSEDVIEHILPMLENV